MPTNPPIAADAPARPEGRKQRLRRLRQRFFEEQDRRCAYCGCEMVAEPNRWNSVTLDHVVPRALGGTDVPGNLVAACRRCNNYRADRPVDLVGPVGRLLALRAIAEARARRVDPPGTAPLDSAPLLDEKLGRQTASPPRSSP